MRSQYATKYQLLNCSKSSIRSDRKHILYHFSWLVIVLLHLLASSSAFVFLKEYELLRHSASGSVKVDSNIVKNTPIFLNRRNTLKLHAHNDPPKAEDIKVSLVRNGKCSASLRPPSFTTRRKAMKKGTIILVNILGAGITSQQSIAVEESTQVTATVQSTEINAAVESPPLVVDESAQATTTVTSAEINTAVAPPPLAMDESAQATAIVKSAEINVAIAPPPLKRKGSAVFAGRWDDPNHPEGYRLIEIPGSKILGFQLASVELSDGEMEKIPKKTEKKIKIKNNSDGQPEDSKSEPEETKLVTFKLNAMVGPIARVDSITIDFTPKGGSSELRGSYDPATDRIVFEDGNAWTRQKN